MPKISYKELKRLLRLWYIGTPEEQDKAKEELIKVKYLDENGYYFNNTNPVYRSATKWAERTYL
jgi:hypothetical protein